MIKRIEVAGLRGKAIELSLDPLTLVLGANTSGKTTVADAIRWALLGYIPGMDAPPRGWAELLAPGATLAEVTAHLAFGKIECAIVSEKGRVKVIWENGESHANLLTLDPTKFLEATGPQQASMLAAATSGGFDWKAVVPEHLLKPGELKNEIVWPPWLEAKLNGAKALRAESASRKKTLAATLRGLEELREIVLEDDTQLKSDLDLGKEKLGRLKEQLRAVTKQIAVAKEPPPNSAERQLDFIRHQLQEFLGQDHDADTFAERAKEVNDRLVELDRMSKDFPDRAGLEELRVETVKLGYQLERLKMAMIQGRDNIELVKTRYARIKKEKCCPTCGAKGKAFTDAIKDAEAAEITREQGMIDQAAAMAKLAESDLAKVNERLAAAEKFWSESDALGDRRNELVQEGKLIELWREHDRLVEQSEQEGKQYDLQALEERRYEFDCELQDQEEQNQELQKQIQELDYRRAQKRQLDEVENELQEAEADWAEENTKVHDLEELRDRLVAMSMEPILKTLELFTQKIFSDPLSLDGTELGRMIGGRWVPLNQFSGAEQAVAVAALTCALKGDPKKQNLVLADELSSFDDAHLGQFLDNVHEAIQAGVLSQFIGFSIPRKNTKSIPKTVTVRTI